MFDPAKVQDNATFDDPHHYATGFAWVLVNGLADRAEDAVHDAWIRASVQLARFEWRSALKTWLTGILLNCIRERRPRAT